MKARNPVAFAMIASLGVAGAVAFANAQTPAPPNPPASSDTGPRGPGGPGGPGEWGPRMDHFMNGEMGPGRHGRTMSKEDRAAFLDARIAAIHAGLRLTPDQEKLWAPAESAVRDMTRTMSELREKSEAAGRPADPIQGMQRMAQSQISRGEAMKKVADAAGPLYATLTPEQKARLPQLARPGMGERMGMWMRHHGMHWGWGRESEPEQRGMHRGSYDGDHPTFEPRGDKL